MSLRRPRFEDEQPAQAINISPLIDVIFILLIFFIVTMVFADGSAMELDIPSAANASEVKADSVTVSISSDSSLYVDGKRLCPAGAGEDTVLPISRDRVRELRRRLSI